MPQENLDQLGGIVISILNEVSIVVRPGTELFDPVGPVNAYLILEKALHSINHVLRSEICLLVWFDVVLLSGVPHESFEIDWHINLALWIRINLVYFIPESLPVIEYLVVLLFKLCRKFFKLLILDFPLLPFLLFDKLLQNLSLLGLYFLLI